MRDIACSRSAKENVVVIKEEDNKWEVEALRRHVEVHSTDKNNESKEEMLSWVISVRTCKKRSNKIKNLDIRKFLMETSN